VTKLPRDVSGDDFIRALRKVGWYRDHQVGSHATLRNQDKPGKKLVVPVHPGRALKPGLLGRLLSEAEISADQLRDLL